MTKIFRAIALASVLAFVGTTIVTPMVSTISAEAQAVKPKPKKAAKITKGKKAKKAVKVKKAVKAKKGKAKKAKAQKAAIAFKSCGTNMYRKAGKCVDARSVPVKK